MIANDTKSPVTTAAPAAVAWMTPNDWGKEPHVTLDPTVASRWRADNRQVTPLAPTTSDLIAGSFGPWISVLDSVPPQPESSPGDEGAYVWANWTGTRNYPGEQRQGVARFIKTLGWQPVGAQGWDWIVTHWIPLPKPPARASDDSSDESDAIMEPAELRSILEGKLSRDATKWHQATDEVRDLHRGANRILELYSGPDFDSLGVDTPSNWNSRGIDGIISLYERMSPGQRSRFLSRFEHFWNLDAQ